MLPPPHCDLEQISWNCPLNRLVSHRAATSHGLRIPAPLDINSPDLAAFPAARRNLIVNFLLCRRKRVMCQFRARNSLLAAFLADCGQQKLCCGLIFSCFLGLNPAGTQMFRVLFFVFSSFFFYMQLSADLKILKILTWPFPSKCPLPPPG